MGKLAGSNWPKSRKLAFSEAAKVVTTAFCSWSVDHWRVGFYMKFGNSLVSNAKTDRWGSSMFKFKSNKFQSALLSSSNFELLTLCQAESDENARYSPGSVVYLGKQNRVRCRAAAVSSKALINEDSKMRLFDSLTRNPMKIHPEIK